MANCMCNVNINTLQLSIGTTHFVMSFLCFSPKPNYYILFSLFVPPPLLHQRHVRDFVCSATKFYVAVFLFLVSFPDVMYSVAVAWEFKSRLCIPFVKRALNELVQLKDQLKIRVVCIFPMCTFGSIWLFDFHHTHCPKQ